MNTFQHLEVLPNAPLQILVIFFIFDKSCTFPIIEIVGKALFVALFIVKLPISKDTGLFQKFALNLGHFETFLEFVDFFISVFDDITAGVPFDLFQRSALIPYHIVLSATIHKSGENIQRLIISIKIILHASINNVGVFIFQIFLNNIFPDFLLAIIIHFNFFQIELQISASQFLNTVTRTREDSSISASFEDIWLVCVDVVAVVSDVLHFCWFPVCELAVYYGAGWFTV